MKTNKEKSMSEILKENQERHRELDRKRRLQRQQEQKEKRIITIGLLVLGLLFIFLMSSLQNQEEQHIQKVSSECAKKGLGIEPSYTKEGDKFYVCQEN